jgi:hypothetical protein
MPKITAQFVAGKALSSRIIILFGGGTDVLGYSHVDLVLPSGRLLGSRSDAILGIPPGVQVRPPFYEKWERREVFELECTTLQQHLFYDYATEQIGKPYDKLSILGFGVGRNWRDNDAWFCDELLMACTEYANLCSELYLPVNKFTPTSAAVVWTALGAKRVST